MKKDMIEVTVNNTSPWKSAFAEAFRNFLEDWGWEVTSYKVDDKEVFVGRAR